METLMTQFRPHYDDSAETRAMLRKVLETSEGFGSLTHVAGHPLSHHLHASGHLLESLRHGPVKSRFRRTDDLVEAFRQCLNSQPGQTALASIQQRPQARRGFDADCHPPFDVECATAKGRVMLTRQDLLAAGVISLRCCAVIEARSRGTGLYLHVQTFYPIVDPALLEGGQAAARS